MNMYYIHGALTLLSVVVVMVTAYLSHTRCMQRMIDVKKRIFPASFTITVFSVRHAG